MILFTAIHEDHERRVEAARGMRRNKDLHFVRAVRFIIHIAGHANNSPERPLSRRDFMSHDICRLGKLPRERFIDNGYLCISTHFSVREYASEEKMWPIVRK